jgi:hypothetical protein
MTRKAIHEKTSSAESTLARVHIPSGSAHGADLSVLVAKMGFTKLDQAILQSSVMAESPEVFKVWIALLAACGPNGIAPISAVYLSSVCRLSQEAVDLALVRLQEPDTHSRTPDHEGRRIKRCNGGWFIYNYAKYRNARSYSDEREAVRKREWREKKKKAMGHVPDVDGTSMLLSSASSSVSSLDVALPLSRSPAADVVRAQMSQHLRRVVAAYPLKSAFRASSYEWAQAVAGMTFGQEAAFADKCIAAIAQQAKGDRWKDKQFIPELRNWLRDGRWDDKPVKNWTPADIMLNKYYREHADERPDGWVDIEA